MVLGELVSKNIKLHRNKNERKFLSKLVPNSQLGLVLCMYFVGVTNSGTMGYDTMMMGSLNVLPQYTSYFSLTPATMGLNTGSVWIGSVLSCLLMQPFSDKWGRKVGILISSIIAIIGVIIQSCAVNIAMFIVGRIIIGFGTQLASAPAPTLISEVVPPRLRGSILGLYFCAFGIGALIASGITYGTQSIDSTWAWRIPSLLQLFFSIMCIVMLPFTPESPRWLIDNKQPEKALEIIEISENISPNDAQVIVDNINKTIQIETAIKMKNNTFNPWKLLLVNPSIPNMRRILILFSLAMLIELGGSSVCSFFMTVVLTQAGVTNVKTQLEVAIIQSAWSLVICYLGSLTFDKLGRKIQAFISTVGMIVSFFILGGLVKKYGNESTDSSNKSGQYGAVAMMFIFTGFYAFTFTPINCLYPPEIFPYSLRSTGCTIFKFFNAGSGLAASFILPIGMANIGWKFYMVNAGYDIIFLPIIYYVWVETKGRSLESITELFGDSLSDQDNQLSYINAVSTSKSLSDDEEIIGVEVKLSKEYS